ncbi:HNH endonuclease signature motif containing protein [Arthrobacter sp. zg-Y877]|uniref:HNH endonuclease signature motif containing protein n=1 Tax=Arthrobacter sp. zg-Y877 TaxID=3049074 RepID=UPI0025A3A93B|nr:HNH endonuclease signature motif containing protein [Arthrobacter sp. zg-Y877]MDM7991567.1 DUF222 domain-containing protein [Arthrobacter sp. zg-Y877]
MDQLGNTEWITEEQDGQDQQPEGLAGESDALCSLAVYRAELSAEPAASGGAAAAGTSASTVRPGNDAEATPAQPAAADGADGTEPTERASASSADRSAASSDGPSDAGNCARYPDGFTGTLALQNLESFDEDMVGNALGRVAHLISWAQAQQARLINRMEVIFRDSIASDWGKAEPGLAFSLAASECAAILNVPQVTGQRMMSEARSLCGTHSATLSGLEQGCFSYQHAQVVLDQCGNLPADAVPEFEASLLKAAEGQTRAQFSAKARRLREKQYPDTIEKRHLTAFEQRKVTLDREEDGMSCLSAHLRAEEAQQIYTTLTTAARGEQTAGDTRTADQLRADILAQLLMGGLSSTRGGGVGTHAGTAPGAGGTDCREGDDTGAVPRAEIMVLISAETLFGADDRPVELHGYGPISAEAARRLARNATGWTGLAQDPRTGEILGVGRRRKVPAGLRRWLRARDGTCRFPGCRVNTANSDIDHTTDWAKGGPTDHGNLEHLCRRHHRFKTLGYWKACQPTPGVMEWTSPTGRVYRTEPFLELGPPQVDADQPPGPPADRPVDPWSGQQLANTRRKDPRQEAMPPF